MAAPATQIPYRFWQSLVGCIFALTCRVSVLNREKSSRKGAWILASNHISHFDPPLFSYVCKRPIDWMAMQELFKGRVFPFLLRCVGTFSVNRGRPDRAAIREAGDRLEAGRVVGIFPEGGIRDGDESILQGGELRPGFTLLAAKHRVPVIPCVILGSDRLYNKRQWLPFRRTPVWIAFGDPLEFPDDCSGHDYRDRLEAELLDAIRSLKTRLEKKFDLRPEDFPQSPQARMHPENPKQTGQDE